MGLEQCDLSVIKTAIDPVGKMWTQLDYNGDVVNVQICTCVQM